MKCYSVLFLSLYSSFLIAQTCCSGGIPLSNSIGLDVLEKGRIQVGLNYDYHNLNTLNSGSRNLNDNSRLRITHSVLLNIGYSITNNISVETLLTWVNQRRRITQFENVNLDQTSGIGDAALLFKYNFPNLLGKNSALNIGLGAKIPLGSSTQTNDIGITLNSDLQPGSNAWDGIYYALFSKNFNFRPTLNFFSRIIYRGTGTNTSYLESQEYKFGNEFQTFIGISENFILFKTLISPSLSFKYRKAKRDTIDGFDIESTGGEWLFLTPIFSINITPTITFTTKVELPLYSYVSGTQLTPTFRITSGVLAKLNLKRKMLILN
jgi:Putative MetA-pathway of phenol degradation